jgi:ribosome-interacting GTPase 1
VVINKSDLMKTPIPDKLITKAIGHDHWIMISALNQTHIQDLRVKIFHELRLIRIYLKPPGKEANMEQPIILHEGNTLETLCAKLHRSFVEHFRYALIWGPSAKHDGQKFSVFNHELIDGDIVSIYLKR